MAQTKNSTPEIFAAAELDSRMDDAAFDALEPGLRTELVAAQHALQEADFPVLILINGVDAAGKGDTANFLNEWLDTRYVRTHALGLPTEEETQRPPYWRFWMALPPKGRIDIFLGSWYTQPIMDRMFEELDDEGWAQALERIRNFEQFLADDGALILKFWLHLNKDGQGRRLKKLEKKSATAWRVTKRDWKHHRRYEEFVQVCAQILSETDRAHAPWIVVEGADAHYRNATVAQRICEALKARLAKGRTPRAAGPPPALPADPRTVLDRIDLTRTVTQGQYDEQMPLLQARLNRLSRRLVDSEYGLLLAFEGWDAAGKGGCIRRVTRALDARQYRVIPIAAPTEEERAQPYLWRFWRHLPRRGRITIYDRSWYGRVLVERIEGFAREEEWRRAYAEINDFEDQLHDHGIVLVKCWMHISPDEQQRRFEERQQLAFKQHKFTAEDVRNREKWPAYEAAVAEMFARTGTIRAPWTLVAAQDKRHARLHVLTEICDRLEAVLD